MKKYFAFVMVFVMLLASMVVPVFAADTLIRHNDFHVLKNDGSVWTWGQNRWGQYGNGTLRDNPEVPVQTIASGAVEIQASGGFSYALMENGDIMRWGAPPLWVYGSYEAFMSAMKGKEDLAKSWLVPTKYFSDVVKFKTHAGDLYMFDSKGDLYVYGDNRLGELTKPAGEEISSLRPPVKISSEYVDVFPMAFRTYYLKADGSIWAAGSNRAGLLGIGRGEAEDISHLMGNDDIVHEPIKILDDVVEVKGNSASAYALKKDGSLWAWGTNWFNEFGTGDKKHSNKPIKILDDVKDLRCREKYTVVLKNDNSIWVAGEDLNDGKWLQISGEFDRFASDSTEYAIGLDGALYGVGFNFYAGGFSSSRFKIVDNAHLIISNQTGGFVVLKNDGTVVVKGKNGLHDLGVKGSDYIEDFTPILYDVKINGKE